MTVDAGEIRRLARILRVNGTGDSSWRRAHVLGAVALEAHAGRLEGNGREGAVPAVTEVGDGRVVLALPTGEFTVLPRDGVEALVRRLSDAAGIGPPRKRSSAVCLLCDYHEGLGPLCAYHEDQRAARTPSPATTKEAEDE